MQDSRLRAIGAPGERPATRGNNMAPQPLGRMPNAPLALVLAQIRYSRYLTMEKHLPALQDAVRHHYPAFRTSQIQSLELTGGAVNVQAGTRWEFADFENRRCFFLQQDSLVFLATAYIDYEDFAERFAEILGHFEALVPDVLVDRVGLRYVDLIVPQSGEAPERYVASGLHGFPLGALAEKAKSLQAQYVSKYDFADQEGLLIARYSRGVSDPYLPADLQPLTLALPGIVHRARARQGQSMIAMLDWDRVLPHRAPFDRAALIARFGEMHTDLGEAFKRATSEYGLKVWNSLPAA